MSRDGPAHARLLVCKSRSRKHVRHSTFGATEVKVMLQIGVQGGYRLSPSTDTIQSKSKMVSTLHRALVTRMATEQILRSEGGILCRIDASTPTSCGTHGLVNIESICSMLANYIAHTSMSRIIQCSSGSLSLALSSSYPPALHSLGTGAAAILLAGVLRHNVD